MKTINQKGFKNRLFYTNIGNKTIYYDEIIHPQIFKELYSKEHPIFSFPSKIIIGDRSFTTFLSKYRKDKFEVGDILLIRISKKDKQAQFVSKIYQWGKINIPKKFVSLLEISNNEKITFEIINKNQLIFSKKEHIDLTEIDHTIIPRGNDYITIYSKQKTPATLPRFIKISPELFELFYLIHGDGHYQNKFYFVNKCPELHQFVLQQFEDIFKISKQIWRARILISDYDNSTSSKSYWKNTLNLKELQFYNFSKPGFNTDKIGNLRIIIDNTIVSSVFRFIFNKLKLNRNFDLYSLNGLLSAEGGSQISKVGLHKITLSFNQSEKDMFKQILDNLKLSYTIEQDKNFIIQGWNNLYLFFNTFFSDNVIPFELHPKRRKNAINGFLKHSFTKTMVKYLKTLKINNNQNVKELAKVLKIRDDSILDTLRKQQYSQFIKIDGKGIRGDPYTFSITEEGNNLLKLINKMEVI